MSLQKCFFRVQSHNPDLPPEEWELVAEFTTPGEYSQSLSWGRYKVIMSGGGGSGAACAAAHSKNVRYANSGSAGEQKEKIVNVLFNQVSVLGGIVASGAKGSNARGIGFNNTGIAEASAGAVGTGYESGVIGGTRTKVNSGGSDYGGFAVGAGSGGGSTSLLVDGVVTEIAKGGNGGNGDVKYAGTAYGGAGGSGGVTSGAGAAGGSGASVLNGSINSYAGANGYVRIYKSNLKPEPI